MEILDAAAAALFWGSALTLLYVYRGYLLVLRGLSAFLKRKDEPAELYGEGRWPSLTVLLTVHNEEKTISWRLENLLSQDYPRASIEILVASDGSSDGTEAIVEDFARRGPVRLFRSGSRLGKSGTQNAAVAQAHGEILVLTDADTVFEPSFLQEIVAPFADPEIGCATGHLRLRKRSGAISRSQGYYWSYELKLRALESRLGILAVASGQALAVRKSCFRDLPLDAGEDCMIPLDVAMQGMKAVHRLTARAFDVMEHEPGREFRSRVRQTMRNWKGTWLRAPLLNPLRHPGYAIALWSHKVLRWLGPVFLIVMTAATASLTHKPLYAPIGLALALVYACALLGWLLEGRDHRLPFVGMAFSFMVANLGFLVGLWNVLRGESITAYRSGSLSQ